MSGPNRPEPSDSLRVRRLALPLACDDFKHRRAERDQVAVGEVEMGELVEMGVQQAGMIEKRHHQHGLAERMAAARTDDGGAFETVGDGDLGGRKSE